MNPVYPYKYRSSSGYDVESAVDGAAYTALRNMFQEFESFTKVSEFLGLKYPSSGSKPGYSNGNGYSPSGYSAPTSYAAPTTYGGGRQHMKSGHSGSPLNPSFALGSQICNKVVAEFSNDGFDAIGNPLPGNPYPDHVPFNEPQETPGITDCSSEIKSLDRWQPLCVPVSFGSSECNVQNFLAPNADKWTTFALPSGDFYRPGGPPLFEEDPAEWERQAAEVVQFSRDLEDVSKITAEHWADGPDSTAPPGHWFRIAMEAGLEKHLDLVTDVKLLFLVGNSINDAGVGAWDAKIFYDSIRPITMIQCGLGGDTLESWIGPYRGVGQVAASEWQPYQAATFVTPAFAGYVSGHSTFSAAAAGALENFFGEEYVGPQCRRVKEGESDFEGRLEEGDPDFVDGLTNVPNQGPRTTGYAPASDVVLCWDTWYEAAEEAGISRLQGGIHIIADHIDGKDIGFKVADRAYSKARELWT
eukprot:evm.model.scf_234.3 EVM.evm.TU.scf_234.3   scf_234:33900-39232(+)